MTAKQILEGLRILTKYDPDGDVCAEHDEVYACNVGPEEMAEQDIAELRRFGWRWDGSSWIHFA